MRSDLVFYPPVLDNLLGVFEVQKPMLIETFITKLAIDTLDESVVRYLS